MEIYDIRVKNDMRIMKDIWVNYPETRLKREEIARRWWNSLYKGEKIEEYRSPLEESMEVLGDFLAITKGNEVLCSKLVGEFFTKIKERYDNEIFAELQGEEKKAMDLLTKMEIKRFLAAKESRMENRFLKEARFKAYRKKVESYNKMWDGIKGEITEYFQLEYEKMRRMKDVLGDSMMNRIGWDLSAFDDKKMFDIEELHRIAVDDEKLNYLLRMLGKKERRKKEAPESSQDEISPNKKDLLGIHMSNDLIRLLPSELSLVHNKHLRSYFHAKYIENRLATYLLSDREDEIDPGSDENESEGPIILCIDTSSSMEGFPEKLAKASALYLMKEAYKKGRKVYVLAFAGEEKMMEFEMTAGEGGPEEVFDFFRMSFYGGTDFISPMKRSIELIEKKRYREADVLMISDGIVKIPEEFKEYMTRIKARLGFQVYSLIINSKDVEDSISDKVLYYHHKRKDIRRGSEYQFHNRGFMSNHG